jgi:hypothetical protein
MLIIFSMGTIHVSPLVFRGTIPLPYHFGHQQDSPSSLGYPYKL